MSPGDPVRRTADRGLRRHRPNSGSRSQRTNFSQSRQYGLTPVFLRLGLLCVTGAIRIAVTGRMVSASRQSISMPAQERSDLNYWTVRVTRYRRKLVSSIVKYSVIGLGLTGLAVDQTWRSWQLFPSTANHSRVVVSLTLSVTVVGIMHLFRQKSP